MSLLENGSLPTGAAEPDSAVQRPAQAPPQTSADGVGPGTDDSRSHGAQLHLARKLMQSSVVERIRQIDDKGRSPAPLVVELDPTTACNLACPDCISGTLLNKGGFQRQRLRELTEEIVEAGARAVILIGGGEPLAHPETGWVIDYLGRHDVHVGVTTNGILINRYEKVLAEHTSWVRVSMDAATSETFQYFRPSPSGVSQFDRIIGNMRKFAAVKRGKLGYSFLLLSDVDADGTVKRSNLGEIYQGAVLAKEIGCDYFEVKPSYDMGHFLISQPEAELAEARRQIEALKPLETETFRILAPVNLQYVLENKPLVEPKEYKRCAVSEMRTLITPSGAYVCPYFRGCSDKQIGDPNSQSFAEIWQGQRRADISAGTDPSRDCRFHCIRHQSNLLMEEMLSGGEVDTISDFDRFI
jgi:MoaA/NifB/PqqE/SkfB family radical SAM enzyme